MEGNVSKDELTLKKCQYLWGEFQYRHDLIWQRVFRLTAVVVLLSIVPYVQRDITALLGYWILFVPFIALGLASFGIFVMKNELDLFDKIKKAYWNQQKLLFPDDLQFDPNEKGLFYRFVLIFMGGLVALSFFNIIVLLPWIHMIVSSSPKTRYW